MSTLHTIGAAQTIDRIIDVCPAGAQNQIRGQLAAVLDALRRIEAGGSVNDELLDVIEMIAAIMDGMKEENAYGE